MNIRNIVIGTVGTAIAIPYYVGIIAYGSAVLSIIRNKTNNFLHIIKDDPVHYTETSS